MNPSPDGARGVTRTVLLLAALAGVGLTVTGGSPGNELSGTRDVRGAWLAPHGMDGYLSPRGRAQMKHLVDIGCNWVAYAPEGTMVDVNRPGIRFAAKDDTCRRVIRELKRAGLKVLLFPRIESPTFFTGEKPKWRGDIEMPDAATWTKFHDNLEAFCVSYARIAASEKADMFCLGLEYRKTTTRFPDRWRAIARAVRAVYDGKLTYSANWYEEYEEVTFWDAVDYIGVGAYFPVTDHARASVREMIAGWRPVKEKLRAISKQYRRPVLFTEIGYPTYADAGLRPWEWTTRVGKVIDRTHQADCFSALFGAFRDEPWLKGLFVWRFHTDMRYVKDWEYCPQGKPAETVIRVAFR